MNSSSPGERAVEVLEIIDVFLVESQCRVDRDFNQTQLIENQAFLHRLSADAQVYHQIRTPIDGTEDIHVVRYLVTGELRALRPGVEGEKQDYDDSDSYASARLTFAADYRCPPNFSEDKEAVSAFVRNAVFHVVPYWRESLSDLTSRMRLPRVTVPMMRPGNAGFAPVTQDAERVTASAAEKG